MATSKDEELRAFLDSLRQEGVSPGPAGDSRRLLLPQDPHAFGVHLVAAAVASGARNIEIQCCADQFLMTFDGQPFGLEEMRGASACLSRAFDPASARLQELMAGLFAGAGLGAEVAEMISAGPQGCVRWHLLNRREVVEPVAPSQAVTTLIRLSRRARPGSGRSEETRKEALIRASCAWAPARIYINGERLRFPGVPREARLVSLIDSANPAKDALNVRQTSPGLPITGIVLYHCDPQLNALHLVVNGVDFPQERAFQGWAVLYCPQLSKDLASSSLQPGQAEPILAFLAQEYASHLLELADAPDLSEEVRRFLIHVLTPKGAAFELPPTVRERLESLPLFPLVGGGLISWRQWLSAPSRRHRTLLYSQKTWPGSVVAGEVCVVDARDSKLLGAVREIVAKDDRFSGYSFEPGDSVLEEAQVAEKRRVQRPQPTESIWADPGSHPLVDGAPRGAVEEAARLWRCGGVRRTEKLRDALLAGIANDIPGPELRKARVVPLAVARSHYPGYQPSPEELADREADQASEDLDAPAAPMTLDQAVGARVNRNRERRAWGEEHASFEELQRQYVSLGYLPVSSFTSSCSPVGGALVALVASERVEQTLSQAFPERRSFEEELWRAKRREQSRARWLSLDPQPVELGSTPPVLVKVALTRVEGLRGEVGVQAGPPSSSTVVFFYSQGRPLGSRYLAAQNGLLPTGLAAAVESSELEADETYSQVLDGPALEQAYKAVRSHLARLVDATAQLFPSSGAARRQLQHQFFSLLLATGLPPDSPRFARIECLDLVGGRQGQLGLLASQLNSQGHVAVVVSPQPPTRVSPSLEAVPLWLTPSLFKVFSEWFGDRPLLQCGGEGETSGPGEVGLSGADWVEPWESRWGRGELGLVADPSIPAFSLRLRVLSEGQLVCQIDVAESAHPAKRAWSANPLRALAMLDCPGLSPGDDYTLQSIKAEALERVRQLGFGRASRLAHLPEEQRAALQDYLWCRLAFEARANQAGDPVGFTVDEDEVRAQLRLAPVFLGADGQWRSLDQLLNEIDAGNRVYYWVEQSGRFATRLDVILVRLNQVPVFRAILGTRYTAEVKV